MSRFDPQKVSVEFMPPANSIYPLEERKYTLTHSDDTGELFLDVGTTYNTEAFNLELRDEVLAEWQANSTYGFILVGKVNVDGNEPNEETANMRADIFKRELGTALKGMIYGDLAFLYTFPFLFNTPIIIYFESSFPQLQQAYYYGTPQQYLNAINIYEGSFS